jgi:hypothetical protein
VAAPKYGFTYNARIKRPADPSIKAAGSAMHVKGTVSIFLQVSLVKILPAAACF